MSREKRIMAGHIMKTAYFNTPVNVEDVVLGGHDLNSFEDETIIKLAHNEALKNIMDLYLHSDMSQKTWHNHIANFLKRGGIIDDTRRHKLAASTAKEVFEFLVKYGW